MHYFNMFRLIIAFLLTCQLFDNLVCAPQKRDNIDERGSFFEGDVRLTSSQKRLIRGAWAISVNQWPGGQVYYSFSNQFSRNEHEAVMKAMRELEEKSCIRWIPRSIHQTDYIKFIKGEGCWSQIGRIGGEQHISLPFGCLTRRGTVRHEMLHALGFLHEQSRPDRDQYVNIIWKNVIEGKEANFEISPTRITGPYDFG